jgi:hypothetical protein
MTVSAYMPGFFLEYEPSKPKPDDEWAIIAGPPSCVAVECPVCEAPPGEFCRRLKPRPTDERWFEAFEGCRGMVHLGRMDKGGGGGE